MAGFALMGVAMNLNQSLHWALGLGLATTFACSSAGRTAAWEVDAPAAPTTAAQLEDAARTALVDEAEKGWAGRDDRASLEKAVAAWEKLLAAAPTDAETMIKLSRGYYFLADGHVSLDPDGGSEKKIELYQKGTDWGERALVAIDPQFAASMKAENDFVKAIALIEKPAVPAAYWYCSNVGRFAREKGLSARLYWKDRLKAAMTRIAEIDPGYFYFGADRYLGSFYALLPGIAGKDLKRSAEHFEKSLTNAPGYLTTRVLKADILEAERGDRAAYEAALKEVLAAADGDDPNMAPENRAAKRHATRLLGLADERF
jgi:hypothetical protein